MKRLFWMSITMALYSCYAATGLSAVETAFSPDGRLAAYRSPYDVAYSPDGKLLAVSDRTAGAAVLIDPAQKKVVREVKLNGWPMGVAWNGGKLYVAEYDAGSVAEIAADSGKVLNSGW